MNFLYLVLGLKRQHLLLFFRPDAVFYSLSRRHFFTLLLDFFFDSLLLIFILMTSFKNTAEKTFALTAAWHAVFILRHLFTWFIRFKRLFFILIIDFLLCFTSILFALIWWWIETCHFTRWHISRILQLFYVFSCRFLILTMKSHVLVLSRLGVQNIWSLIA